MNTGWQDSLPSETLVALRLPGYGVDGQAGGWAPAPLSGNKVNYFASVAKRANTLSKIASPFAICSALMVQGGTHVNAGFPPQKAGDRLLV